MLTTFAALKNLSPTGTSHTRELTFLRKQQHSVGLMRKTELKQTQELLNLSMWNAQNRIKPLLKYALARLWPQFETEHLNNVWWYTEDVKVVLGDVTFRTWKSLASLHRSQKRGRSRCSTVSLLSMVTTLHMICRRKHMEGVRAQTLHHSHNCSASMTDS